MFRRLGFFSVCLLVLHLSVRAELVYPQYIHIKKFTTGKAIYKPGEPVAFLVSFASNRHAKDLDVQIWIEREIDTPFMATSQKVQGKYEVQNIEIIWKNADKSVYGHRATVRFVDPQGRLLAEKEALFDVADNWIDVMRMVSIGTKNVAVPEFTDQQIAESIAKMRSAYFNAMEMWTPFPEPYVLNPPEKQWKYQYSKPGKEKIISKERLLYWGDQLHKNGMKYICYNETSAAKGPDDWKTYHDWCDNFKTAYAHYFKDEGYFTPNSIKIADLFAEQLAGSVKTFNWDGILMDSAIACHIRTSTGFTKGGKARLTDLTVGEVGYKYLEKAKKLTREINPEFCFLSQNATSVSHNGVKLAPDKMYPWIMENAKKQNIRKYSELADLYTLEIDSHHSPRDGRYPLTYEKMSIALNSVIEVTGRPLMSWAYVVTPFYDEYSVAFTRHYMATIYASRTKLHDHFDAYGGAWSDGSESPASQQFIKYNRFIARYSWYLWDSKLKWVLDPYPDFKVSASRSLFWNRLVYERDLGKGKKQTIINLLNFPSNGCILAQREIPSVAQNVTLKIKGDLNVSRAVFLDADSDNLKPLVLKSVRKGKDYTVYRIPPITCWGMVVIDR